MSSTTLTVRLPAEVKHRLNDLAKATSRSKSFLAAEAIAAYVAREMEITENIHRGLADVKARRVTSHDDAMDRIYATIEKAESKQ